MGKDHGLNSPCTQGEFAQSGRLSAEKESKLRARQILPF